LIGIGAAFLNNHAGILNDETLQDSTAYIQGWLKQLRNDKKFIIEGFGQSAKGCGLHIEQGELESPFFCGIPPV
jgi:antirestriction protein ArdC